MPYTGDADSPARSLKAACAEANWEVSNFGALMAEWGVHVSYTTIMRWVSRYVPEYERRWNRQAKPVGSPWRVDETHIRTRSKTGYLYRAVDKQEKTVESLFETRRGIAAAMALFRKTVASSAP
jgi:transposase-like protein